MTIFYDFFWHLDAPGTVLLLFYSSILFFSKKYNKHGQNNFVFHSVAPVADLKTDEVNEQFSETHYKGDLSLDDYRNIVQKQKEKNDGETG